MKTFRILHLAGLVDLLNIQDFQNCLKILIFGMNRETMALGIKDFKINIQLFPNLPKYTIQRRRNLYDYLLCF